MTPYPSKMTVEIQYDSGETVTYEVLYPSVTVKLTRQGSLTPVSKLEVAARTDVAEIAITRSP
jgi:hypothetical protein